MLNCALPMPSSLAAKTIVFQSAQLFFPFVLRKISSAAVVPGRFCHCTVSMFPPAAFCTVSVTLGIFGGSGGGVAGTTAGLFPEKTPLNNGTRLPQLSMAKNVPPIRTKHPRRKKMNRLFMRSRFCYKRCSTSATSNGTTAKGE